MTHSVTHDFECTSCAGYGTDDREIDGQCFRCGGTGWISCARGGLNCPYDICACEGAWERQEADKMSEPPVSMDEQHRAAWKQKQDLRR